MDFNQWLLSLDVKEFWVKNAEYVDNTYFRDVYGWIIVLELDVIQQKFDPARVRSPVLHSAFLYIHLTIFLKQILKVFDQCKP